MTDQPITDNETFVTLLRVAQEDAKVGNILRAILNQPSFQRRSMLNALLHDMRIEAADPAFIAAIEYLLNDDVAEKAAAFIATA